MELSVTEVFGEEQQSTITGVVQIVRSMCCIILLSRELQRLYHSFYIRSFHRDNLLKQGAIEDKW